MKKKYCIALFLTVSIISSCGSSDQETENRVNDLLRSGNSLMVLDAIFNVAFCHYDEHWIYSNDIYLRYGEVDVKYGFALDTSKIEVKNKILYVTLKEPQVITTGKKTIFIKNTHDNYKPSDKNGNPINVEESINRTLKQKIQELDKMNIRMTKERAEGYFRTVASRFGLKLEIRFI
jgi:hypothetical protein